MAPIYMREPTYVAQLAATLDELSDGRASGGVRSSLLHGDPQEPDVANRVEALSILTSLAREERTSVAIAPVRELRPDDEASIDDAIDRILGS